MDSLICGPLECNNSAPQRWCNINRVPSHRRHFMHWSADEFKKKLCAHHKSVDQALDVPTQMGRNNHWSTNEFFQLWYVQFNYIRHLRRNTHRNFNSDLQVNWKTKLNRVSLAKTALSPGNQSPWCPPKNAPRAWKDAWCKNLVSTEIRNLPNLVIKFSLWFSFCKWAGVTNGWRVAVGRATFVALKPEKRSQEIFDMGQASGWRAAINRAARRKRTGNSWYASGERLARGNYDNVRFCRIPKC